MGEDMKLIISILGSVLGLVAAILGVHKAYIEVKKRRAGKEEPNMNNSNNSGRSTNISGNSGNIVINQISDTTNTKKTPEEQSEKNENVGDIKLNKNYTSLFAEENKLKSEQITIDYQKNGVVKGTVTLVEKDQSSPIETKHIYSLEGKYNNKILTAEYSSQDKSVDERGAINLKLIDSDILSGFCSFSKSATLDDEIRVSPYVWVSGKDQDLIDGTFEFCQVCHDEHRGCCCASDRVDMPIFLNNELNLIRKQLPNHQIEKSMFSKSLAKPYQNSYVRQMKPTDKKDQNGKVEHSGCHFYDAEQQTCKIYEGRPIDCRLFPFDIRLSNSRKEYVIIYYTNLCNCHLPDKAIMKKKAHILRPYFFLLYPYLHIITCDDVCKKLKTAEYEEIADFKDFIF